MLMERCVLVLDPGPRLSPGQAPKTRGDEDGGGEKEVTRDGPAGKSQSGTRAARISTSASQLGLTSASTCTKLRTGLLGFASVPKNCR